MLAICRENIFFKYYYLQNKGTPYFRVPTNKYGEDYEDLKLIILMLFVNVLRIAFTVLNFEFILS
jgi:hypothetical protein